MLRIRTLLRAALRLEPKHTQALTWLYELSLRGGDSEAARQYLHELVAADPDNITAFANWLNTRPPDVQTIEQRRDWLTGLLRETNPEKRALVLVQMAVASWRQGDLKLARRQLTEARQVWPACPEAALRRLELITSETPLAERVDTLLRALELDPLRMSAFLGSGCAARRTRLLGGGPAVFRVCTGFENVRSKAVSVCAWARYSSSRGTQWGGAIRKPAWTMPNAPLARKSKPMAGSRHGLSCCGCSKGVCPTR